jgi:hypothetical protein
MEAKKAHVIHLALFLQIVYDTCFKLIYAKETNNYMTFMR